MAVDGKTYPKTCLRIQPSIGTTNNGVRQVGIEKLMTLLHEATREQAKKKENGLP